MPVGSLWRGVVESAWRCRMHIHGWGWGSSVLRVSECRGDGGGDGTCCVGCDVSRRRVWGDVP